MTTRLECRISGSITACITLLKNADGDRIQELATHDGTEPPLKSVASCTEIFKGTHVADERVEQSKKGVPVNRRGFFKGAGLVSGAALSSQVLAGPNSQASANVVSTLVQDNLDKGVYNVMDFGAVGDGLTDDRAAIQSALEAVQSSGGVVYLPPGTYRHVGRLNVDGDDVTLLGVGMASKLILAANSDSNSLRVNTTEDPSGATRLKRFAMRDIYIDHQGRSQASAAAGTEGCLFIYQVDHVDIENVYLTNVRDVGFQLFSNEYVKLRGCTVDDITFGLAGNGFNLGGTTTSGAADHSMIGCVVTNGVDRNFWVGGVNASRLTVMGCMSRGGNVGIDCEVNAPGATDITIIGNTVEGASDQGIGITNSSGRGGQFGHRIVIANNVVNGGAHSTTGIGVQGGIHNSVIGNVVSGVSEGIRAGSNLGYDEAEYIITDNSIALRSDAAGSGIKVGKASSSAYFIRNVQVHDNVLVGSNSTGGGSGILIGGNVKDFSIIGNGIRYFSRNGVSLVSVGSLAPTEGTIALNRVVDNNASGYGEGQEAHGAGISLGNTAQAIDHLMVSGNRVYDSRATKKQFGIYAGTTTNCIVQDNDLVGGRGPSALVGNVIGGIVQGNIATDAPYQGAAGLVGGAVTVRTAAVRRDSQIHLTASKHRGRPGALYVGRIRTGQSFEIRSTSRTDASTVRWRIS
jgi:hypothetical protein